MGCNTVGITTELGLNMDESEQNNGNSVVKQAGFTEQQIEEHCKDLERCMKLKGAIAETSYLPISIQIIRQLQEDIKSRDKLDKRNFEALRACSLSARS